MPQHPFLDPGPDGEEPDSSPLLPAADGTAWRMTGEGAAAQGLCVCLRAEGVRAPRL